MDFIRKGEEHQESEYKTKPKCNYSGGEIRYVDIIEWRLRVTSFGG